MPVIKEYIIEARDELEKIRSQNKNTEELRRREILRRIPKYGELEIKLADSVSGVIPLIASKAPDCREKIAEASRENILIQREMKRILTDNGYPEDYLEPIYSCKKCLDKGIYNGDWCDCLKKKTQELAVEELNRHSPLQLCSFESFDLSYYDGESENGVGAREAMTEIYNYCKNFADSFDGRGNGIFMIGGTGLGKTHLSLAIAKRVIERNFCVLYNSVPELLRTLDDEQFGRRAGNTMTVTVSCDLLILDDLGAENTNERNASTLYEIINSRMSRRLPIIVSTNYSTREIKSHYDDRIFSRLIANRVFKFQGKDNRLRYLMAH